jgi:hypothetical protein
MDRVESSVAILSRSDTECEFELIKVMILEGRQSDEETTIHFGEVRTRSERKGICTDDPTRPHD